MGWRPDHHQSEQPPAPEANMARGGRRPNQGRNGPGDPTDDDVLGRPRLEQGCVEQHVTAEAEQGQPSSETVHTAYEKHRRREGAGDGADECTGGRQPTGGECATAGAGHPAIEILLPQAVQNPCSSGGKRPSPQGADEPRR